MRTLSLAACSLALSIPCLSMEWQEVEIMAAERKGRVVSLFEIAAEGRKSDMLALGISSYDPELQDALGRTIADIAHEHQNHEIYEFILSLPQSSAPQIKNVSDTKQQQLQQQQDAPELVEQAIVAIYSEDALTLRRLLASGLSPDAFSEPNKMWLLEAAINIGSLPLAQILVEAGADINKRSRREAMNKTLLMVATRYDQAEIVNYLLKKGADIHARGTNQANVLHDASYYASVRSLPFLLPYFQEDNFSPSCSVNGYPIQIIFYDQPHSQGAEVIECFKNAGFNFNDMRFNPPLLVLPFTHNKPELIRPLLSAGADPAAIDSLGRSSFDYLSNEQILLLLDVKEDLEAHSPPTPRSR